MQIVAALASSSLVFKDLDPAYSEELFDAATVLYGKVSDLVNRGIYSNVILPDCRNGLDPVQVSFQTNLSCTLTGDINTAHPLW